MRRGETAVADRDEGRRPVRPCRVVGALDRACGDRAKGIAHRIGAGDVIETCTILTTAANKIVAPVHDRMPLILPPEAFDPWLAGKTVPVGPYPPETMAVHPVSALVNKAANDDPRCIEPVATP